MTTTSFFTPSPLAVADGAAVARWANGVRMVSKDWRSTGDDSRKVREVLDKVGARISGVVWDLEGGADGGRCGYYGYVSCGGYYSDYVNTSVDDKSSSKNGKVVPAAKASRDDHCIAIQIPAAGGTYIPPVSPGRKFFQTFDRTITGVLVAVAVVAMTSP